MQGVIVEFRYGDDFDSSRLAAIARDAQGKFEGMPGLRQKAFTVDEQNRRAVNVYLWDSEETARAFFGDALLGQVTALYGIRPTVSFVEVVELVDNG